MEPGVVMATQNFKRNLFLNLYRKEEKNLTLVCFLLLLKREIKMLKNVAAYFLCLETPALPACYTLIPPFSFRRIRLPRERGVVLVLSLLLS